MALYCYLKSSPNKTSRIRRKLVTLLSAVFILLGLGTLGQAIYPVAAWYFVTLPTLSAGVASPLATDFRPERSLIFPTIVAASEAISPSQNSYQASSWFVGAKPQKSDSTATAYSLTIPKLNITEAIVKVSEDDLKKSLIGWPGSALPGTYGTAIVFGHSELPQFASPTDYKGIFTFLMDLENGDEIIVGLDGLRYKYTVVAKKIVSPTDLSVLEQRFDDSYLSLITCVPPGTLWMRGIVTAKLTKI